MEFFFVFFVCPAIVLITSIIGYFIAKRWYVMPLLTFVVFTILTFTVFNATFFIWALGFTILSAAISLLMKLIKKSF